MTTNRYPRSAIAAMYAGLLLSIGSILVLHLDQASGNVLAEHIRSGYPGYDQDRIDSAVSIYVVYLSTVGILAVLAWLAMLWATTTGRTWTRWVATTLFAVGTSIALFNLLVRDTSGDTGLPPLLGWVGLLPCLAGAVAVVALWRRGAARTE